MTSCSCTALAAKNSAALRASRADARRLELRVDAGPGAAREATAEEQLAFVSAVRRAALAVEALCAGRGDDGEAPAGRRAVRVVADGWLDLLVPALRAPPGRLRPAQGHAAAALRRVCCAAAASPAAVLAIVSCGAVAALADCAIRRGEDAPAADAKADAACALAALARDPDAACRVAAELLAAGALAIGANGAADWTPRARAPRGAAAREAFAALLGAVGRANGSSWRAPLFALAAADAARGDAAAPAAAIVALCDAADSALATGPRASGLADDDGAAAVVAPLVVAGAVDALVRALADPRTAPPVRARVEASLAAIAPRLDVARPVVVDALRVTAASTAAAARDAVAEAARGEAQLWATFAAAIQTKLIANRSGGDGDAASVTDVGTTRAADVDERAVRSGPDHVRGEAQDDQKHKEGKNKPFARPPQMAHSPSDGDAASPLPLPAGAASAAPARVNPKLKAPGARAPSDAYRDQPARCAPAPFGSLVGDYGAVPAYAAAPSPPMRENNAESEPRATSPPDDTSARESPSLGPRLALGSLRGRAPRVVVDTVALRGPAVRTASSRSLTSLDLAGRASSP